MYIYLNIEVRKFIGVIGVLMLKKYYKQRYIVIIKYNVPKTEFFIKIW